MVTRQAVTIRTHGDIQYLRMVHIGGRHLPRCRGLAMAIFAGIGTANMPATLAAREHTVMAAHAIGKKSRVINSRTLPGAGVVTALTGFRRWDMING